MSRAGHDLEGKSIVGQVLVCPGVQGGVAGGWVLLSLARSGFGFAGMAFRDINPVIVQAALLAEIPLLTGIDGAALDQINTGDLVRLLPSDHKLQLLSH